MSKNCGKEDVTCDAERRIVTRLQLLLRGVAGGRGAGGVVTHDAGGRPITGLQDTRTDIAGTARRCRVGAAEIPDCRVQATHHRPQG